MLGLCHALTSWFNPMVYTMFMSLFYCDVLCRVDLLYLGYIVGLFRFYFPGLYFPVWVCVSDLLPCSLSDFIFDHVKGLFSGLFHGFYLANFGFIHGLCQGFIHGSCSIFFACHGFMCGLLRVYFLF